MSLKDQIERGVAAHGAWKERLAAAIGSGSSTFDPATVSTDCNCDFGKWLHGLGDGEKGQHFDSVRTLHAEFHSVAGKVLSLATTGKSAEASALMDGDYAVVSAKLVDTLHAWAAT